LALNKIYWFEYWSLSFHSQQYLLFFKRRVVTSKFLIYYSISSYHLTLDSDLPAFVSLFLFPTSSAGLSFTLVNKITKKQYNMNNGFLHWCLKDVGL
jgi:hypothetical protein